MVVGIGINGYFFKPFLATRVAGVLTNDPPLPFPGFMPFAGPAPYNLAIYVVLDNDFGFGEFFGLPSPLVEAKSWSCDFERDNRFRFRL